MKNRVMVLLISTVLATAVNAQTTSKKVYNEDINPVEQIDQAVARLRPKGNM